ncbi:O-antigen ligase family protein [Halobacillus massiliensis]|uniref:O-antigen ligase family protein n=1 Tax=Halobacillus massiliensis TaxID=1926286 RepID=UPI0015C4E1EA|nr:O-antigen ligase family protein [Halobacillus massiliensis]
MKFMRMFLSGEFLFAVYLFSSTIKLAFNDILPAFVDLTAIFLLLSLLAGLKKSIYEGIPKRVIFPSGLYAAICLIMLVSIFYSTSENYAITKVIEFIVLTGWSFIGGFFLVRDHQSLRQFLKYLLFIAVGVSLYVLWSYFNSPNLDVGRVGVAGGSVLGLAKITGMGSIIILLLYYYGRSSKKEKVFSAFALGIMGFVLLLTGSRMALIALGFTVLLVFILSLDFTQKDIKIKKRVLKLLPLIPLAGIAGFVLYRNGTIDTLLIRIGYLFNQQSNSNSVSGRLERYQVAWDMFSNSPLMGNGIGSFAIEYTGIDQRNYPHNIFLEFMSEMGTVGFILFLVLLLSSFLAIFRMVWIRKITPEKLCVILLLVFQLINVNTTGDFNDNRIFFALLGLTLTISSIKVQGSNLVKQVKVA